MQTTEYGAFMEPRGCKRWQSVANRIGAESPETSQNRCRRLRPVLVRNAMKKGLPDDRLRLVVWSYRRGGPLRCCTPDWISVASVSISTCSTQRVRPSTSAHQRRTPMDYVR